VSRPVGRPHVGANFEKYYSIFPSLFCPKGFKLIKILFTFVIYSTNVKLIFFLFDYKFEFKKIRGVNGFGTSFSRGLVISVT